MTLPPHLAIPVGVIATRTNAASAWVDYLWSPTAVLVGVPETLPWTQLTDDGERATFYAGAAEVVLHRTETGNYRDNLQSGEPSLWVALRPTDAEPPYTLFAVTADPAEGEAWTEAGSDLVDKVRMPEQIAATLAEFIAAHHVERERFEKRKRDRANPDALSRQGPLSKRDRS